MIGVRLFRRLAHQAAQQEPSTSSQSAWSLLQQRIATVKPSEEELTIIRRERPWATASRVLCLCTTSKKSAEKEINIRWPSNPERNIDVGMPSDTNFYSLQVYAIYYGLISAYGHGEKYVSTYSGNEVAVKVGNGVFKAAKEKKIFDRIQRRMGENDVIMARLSLLSPSVLEEMGIENVDKLKAAANVSEGDFRDRHSSALIMV